MRTYYTFTYCDGNNQIEVMITDKSTGSFCEILRCPIETVLDIFEEVPPAQLAWICEDKDGTKFCVPGDIVEHFDYKSVQGMRLSTFIKDLLKGTTCPC